MDLFRGIGNKVDNGPQVRHCIVRREHSDLMGKEAPATKVAGLTDQRLQPLKERSDPRIG